MTLDKDLFATVADENVVNEILAFCSQGTDGRDLLPLSEYAEDAQRKIGHQPGIARAKLANRQARQASHICAGLAQFLARRYEAGIVDDGDLDKIEAALAKVFESIINRIKYEVGEIYNFLEGSLKPGMVPAMGALIAEADRKYPEAWDFLQTARGQAMCVTEAQWQAMSTAVFATSETGTEFSWGGVGGAPKYVLDTAAKTIRVPDLRGMFAEPAGFNGLSVSGAQGFAMPQIWAGWPGTHPAGTATTDESHNWTTFGAGTWSYHNDTRYISLSGNGSAMHNTQMMFDSCFLIPYANVIRPRSYGVLTCAYLGHPQES